MSLSWLPDFVAVDIETTGLAAQQDDLLEIAGVRFVAGEPVDRFVTTLHLDKTLAKRTARLTGLTDAALAAGLPVGEAMRGLDAFAGDLPLVAHNVSLDREFLTRFSLGLEGVDLTESVWWDSLELAALVFPELESLALEHVATALGIPVGTTHRAEADAILAGRIFAGLFAHIQQHWSPTLIDAVRNVDLATEPFGELLRRMPLPEYAPEAQSPLPVPTACPDFQPDQNQANGDPARELILQRVDEITDSLSDASLAGHRSLYPPHLYPGQFHGPDKELRVYATELGISCESGQHCILDREKLELLLAGGVAIPGQLHPFERAFLRAWAAKSETGDFARLSWWALNNFPTLAATLMRISNEHCERPASQEPESANTAMRLVPWEAALTSRVPWSASESLAITDAQWAVLVPVYYPLHALRGAIRIWQVGALNSELTWFGALLEIAGGPLAAWWTSAGATLLATITALEQALAAYGHDVQHPASVSRGEEHYWPLNDSIGDEAATQTVTDAIRAVAESLRTHLDGGRSALVDAALPVATQRLIVIMLRRLESFRIAVQWMSSAASGAHLIVVKQQHGRDSVWWGLAAAPSLPRDIASLVPGSAPLPMISTFMDAQDWREVERLWKSPARAITFIDHASPTPKGNTVHLPLPPAGTAGTPAKKVWQNWQLSILKRLIQRESGRWLIVARNPQDVVTLHHRLRDPMLQADWQPLFQRHDGTKGFLMKEFGSFEKVAMVATGEILQELNRFPVAPDTIVVLHVPTRPPNELVCVALQQQLGMTAEQFREEVMVPLGIIDLKRAFNRWPVYREGNANLYVLDFRQLELPPLKALLRASFPNQELIDTRPAVQY